jgi:hypothetical protein
MGHAMTFIQGIFKGNLFQQPTLPDAANLVIFFIIFTMFIEWLGRESKYALERFSLNWYAPFRWLFYFVLIACVIVLSGKEQEFIYFQF